jgi:uncharacterized membrane protein
MGIAKAALVGCVAALSACGGDGPMDPTATAPAADPATDAPGALGGPSTQTPGQQTVAVTGAQPPLDTATWVLAPPFYAAGQEPFWRLDIVDGWFEFRRSGLTPIEEPLAQPKQQNGADVFATGALQVSIKREACEAEGVKSDYIAKVTFDGLDFDGCAFDGQVAASPAAATVVEELASIDACLAKLGQPALVTAVYPRHDGEQKGVAMRARNGQLYECATDAAGATIAYLDPIERGAEAPWMSRMRFLRSSVTATVSCPTAEDVRSGDEVVGRLLAKACKF